MIHPGGKTMIYAEAKTRTRAIHRMFDDIFRGLFVDEDTLREAQLKRYREACRSIAGSCEDPVGAAQRALVRKTKFPLE